MLDRHLAMVERFQREILGYPIPEKPTMLNPRRAKARNDHLREEADELLEAQTIEKQADALIDSIYVALGGLVEMGVLPGPLFEAVHDANMQKRRGTVARRENHEGYDAVKPLGWYPADLSPFMHITRADIANAWALRQAAERSKPAELKELKTPGAASLRDGAQKRADRAGGMKFDGGKERWSLLVEGMPRGLRAVVGILEYGAKKYAPHNWKKVDDGLARYKEAFYRHAVAPEGLFGCDPESGLRHAAHAACDLLFLLEMLEGDPCA